MANVNVKTKGKEARTFEALIEGYEHRVSTVTAYMTEAAALLAQLGGEQEAMLVQLQDTLAQQRSLRRADFEKLVQSVVSERRQRLQDLPALIEEFRRAEEAVGAKLHRLVDGDAADVARAWPELKKEMLSLQRTRESNVSRALKRVHIEQEELCRGLRGLLAKGERVRIGDLKAVVREINAVSPKESADLAGLLKDCQLTCAEVSEAWQNVV